jgi:hypothetical protein
MTSDDVLSALEANQLVVVRSRRRGRRRLGRGGYLLMWLLRAYMVFMLVVVIVRLFQDIHPG